MPDLLPVFQELRRRLSVHEDAFRVSENLTDANAARSRKQDAPAPGSSYLLLATPDPTYPDGRLFAAVQVGKRYVSYHLMCLYAEPALAGGISPELTRRRQGKSCFSFTRVDDALFDELADLTARGRELYAERGMLAPPGRPGRRRPGAAGTAG